MNREIKFRVWDGIDYMSTPFTLKDLQDRKIMYTDGVHVMQFTGFKDENGKEIYESDILIDKEADEFGNDISGYLPVVFCQNTAQWCVDNSFKKDGSHLVNIVEYLGIEHLEVVGNIYENPLVLENENRVI
jgi:uncharacterized phage protein (TIGR01671 family)